MSSPGAQARIGVVCLGADHALPWRKANDWNRMVVYRPADGVAESLNPPRFSWPYLPGVFPGDGDVLAKHATEEFAIATALFTLEIAADGEFKEVLFRIEKTPFNFYNAIGPLPTGKLLHWRVGYLDDAGSFRRWSDTRSFTIDTGAIVWDRVKMTDFHPPARPRLLSQGGSLEEVREKFRGFGDCPDIAEYLKRLAESVPSRSWWKNIPDTDRYTRRQFAELCPDAGNNHFTAIAQDLAILAFYRLVSGEGGREEIAAQAAKIAAFEIGGLSGPEGGPGSEGADVAQLPEFLSLIYDFCFGAADPEDLRTLRDGLAWRVRWSLDNFCWKASGGTRMARDSIAVSGSSHPFEASMGLFGVGPMMAGDPELPADQAELYRTLYDLGLHFIVGVTSSFGYEDGWNEGPGYGNSKMQWLMNAVGYYELTAHRLSLARNPAFKGIGDFFIHTSPLGLRAAPFGNGSVKQGYVIGNRMSSAYRLAMLLGDGAFRTTWTQSQKALSDVGAGRQWQNKKYWRPWIAFGLAARAEPPAERDAPTGPRLFPESGWLTVATEPPNRYDRFGESVGMVVQARSRGGYQHAFYSDGSPQLWAFGEPINFGSGSTANKDLFAHSPFSTNTVLVNGVGQRHIGHWRKHHFVPGNLPRQIARFAAYHAWDESNVYFLADVTAGYPAEPCAAGHWWGDHDGPYQTGPLPGVVRAHRHGLFLRGRYFVFFDDYRVDPEGEPVRFDWLWHILKQTQIEPIAPGHIRYSQGDVLVDLVHAIGADELSLEDRRGSGGAVNPVTGEDYTECVHRVLNGRGKEAVQMEHNLWFTPVASSHARRFLSVIYPRRAGESPPQIEPAGDSAVRVAGLHGEDVIDFAGGAVPEANVRIDAKVLGDIADRIRREGNGG